MICRKIELFALCNNIALYNVVSAHLFVNNFFARLRVRLYNNFLNIINIKKFAEDLARKFNYDYDILDFTESRFQFYKICYIRCFNNIFDNINTFYFFS